MCLSSIVTDKQLKWLVGRLNTSKKINFENCCVWLDANTTLVFFLMIVAKAVSFYQILIHNFLLHSLALPVQFEALTKLSRYCNLFT